MRTISMRSLAWSLVPLLISLAIYAANPQESDEWSAFYPESYARETAVRTVTPVYPEEAVRRGVSGVVAIKIAIDDQGKVDRIRIKHHTDPLLKAAVASAVKQWVFRPRSDGGGLGKFSMSRLTFNFLLQGAEAAVTFYDPGPAATDQERIGYCNTAKELKEWGQWEEIPLDK